MNCQSFSEGCCGCCINMRWPAERITAWFEANTRIAEQLLKNSGKPNRWQLLRWHLRRSGWIDHLLAFWLAPLSLGLTALLWQRYFGSCCFAGFIDPPSRRVGCLIHPARWQGGVDLRRYAFPLIPTLNCNRSLICPMLLSTNHPPLNSDWLTVSRAGATSLQQRQHREKPTSAAQ